MEQELRNKIKEARIKKNISVRRLSMAAGVSPTCVFQIETSMIKNPNVGIMMKICDALEIDITKYEYLTTGQDKYLASDLAALFNVSKTFIKTNINKKKLRERNCWFYHYDVLQWLETAKYKGELLKHAKFSEYLDFINSADWKEPKIKPKKVKLSLHELEDKVITSSTSSDIVKIKGSNQKAFLDLNEINDKIDKFIQDTRDKFIREKVSNQIAIDSISDKTDNLVKAFDKKMLDLKEFVLLNKQLIGALEWRIEELTKEISIIAGSLRQLDEISTLDKKVESQNARYELLGDRVSVVEARIAVDKETDGIISGDTIRGWFGSAIKLFGFVSIALVIGYIILIFIG